MATTFALRVAKTTRPSPGKKCSSGRNSSQHTSRPPRSERSRQRGRPTPSPVPPAEQRIKSRKPRPASAELAESTFTLTTRKGQHACVESAQNSFISLVFAVPISRGNNCRRRSVRDAVTNSDRERPIRHAPQGVLRLYIVQLGSERMRALSGCQHPQIS